MNLILDIANLDRTVYEHLRLKLVSLGYLPDILVHNTEASYQAAKAAIRASGKEVIELMSIGSDEAKDGKTICKIVIEQQDISPSQNLGGGTSYFESYTHNNNPLFRKKRLPSNPMVVQYRVKTVSNSTSYDRIMLSAIFDALGSGVKYLKVFGTTSFMTAEVPLFFSGRGGLNRKGFIEKVYSFTFDNVWLSAETLKEGIVPLTSINFNLGAAALSTDFNSTVPTDAGFVDNIVIE